MGKVDKAVYIGLGVVVIFIVAGVILAKVL